ncbi:hypothetical protein [Foetidibacter luteolus]|uniref:hypothetical protein n=1 Tax=Foetidibacter luteolus TaxID=2608880 RepID=UPI00129C07B8|nr:hypothetical protein [Foetidibacter luteolus]
MAQLHFHKSIRSFLSGNIDYFNKNYLATETLRNLIEKHLAKELSINNAINVNEGNKRMLAVVFNEYIMLYGDHYSQEMIDELSKKHTPLPK